MSHTPHTLTASYLVLLQGESVLLQRRFQTGFMDGMYSLPAGHIEPNESATTALAREINEEIGIVPLGATVAHIMQRDAGNGLEYIDIFFTTSTWQGEPRNCEPEKCDDLSWYPLTALPENTIPYIKAALEHIQNAVPFCEFGYNQL